MLKRIKLTIKSQIDNLDDYGLPDGDSEVNETSYNATMRISGEDISIAYKETDENGTVNCTVALLGSSVTVKRNGAIVSTMVFDKNEVYNTTYLIPPYKFDMEIKTKRLKSSFTESGGYIDILYDMTVGGASKKAQMKITAIEV